MSRLFVAHFLAATLAIALAATSAFAAAAPGGVGLGLTICRGIVTAHNGRIWAENRAGGGAVFSFTLPLPSHPPAGVPGEPAEG